MIEFKIPEIGENIGSGTVISIAVSVGDTVKKDQDLLEFETEKASLPIPSPCDGVIKEILMKEGDEVKVGQVIMKIDEESSPQTTQPPKEETETEAPASKQEETPKTPAPKQEETPKTPKGGPVPPASATRPSEQIPAQVDIPAAPSVRRFAREIGIEIAQVPGSGPGGHISTDDVKAYAKKLLTGMAAPAAGGIAAKPLPDFTKWGGAERKVMSNIRKKISEHLSYCWATIPHVTQFDKADITELEKLRKNHSTPERKLTVTPFLLKVMASALKEFPQFNASVDTATNEIIYKKYFHIGVAVDTDHGLVVPVVRDVDKKSIFQLADELHATAERTRSRKITLDELKGGSMTLTNLGGIGGTSFAPVINWPEVAILGVARGTLEPRYENGSFVPRFMLPLSLSYDHRLIDGADGIRFLRWIIEALEDPFLMELKG